MIHFVETWEEWCKVYYDLDFWVPEIEVICRAHQVDIVSLEKTYPGTHAVFLINRSIVLKIFCSVQYNSYNEELTLHQGVLSRRTIFPKILFHGQSASGYDYLAFELAAGRVLRELGINAIQTNTLDDLVEAVLWLQANTLQRQPSGELSCLLHADLTRDHIFLDESGRLTGIIDFGDAVVGPPGDEFPVLFIDAFDCVERLVIEFIRRYNERCPFYQITPQDIQRGLDRHPFRQNLQEILNGRLPAWFASM